MIYRNYPSLFYSDRFFKWQDQSSLRQSRDSKINFFFSLSRNKYLHFIHLKIQLLILFPYIGVPQTVHLYQSNDKSVQLERSSRSNEFKMSSTPIKSCKKYVLSYKDSSNSTHQLGFYARDAYDCLMLAREFNSYVHDHPRSVVRIQQKF